MVQLSDIRTASNLVTLFLARADARGDRPFLSAKREGKWQSQSWSEVASKVCLMAESLRKLGLNDGDRVMLVSENRPEWCIADLAIMAAGCITVPAYTTNTERDHQHVLENSDAKAVIVGNPKLAKQVLPAVLRSGLGNQIIGIEGLGQTQSGAIDYHEWPALFSGDAAQARAAVDARIAKIKREDTACIIYTSGTGGAPRGVMQHHGAILCNVMGAALVLEEDFGLEDE
uniref:AMP-binding protein n=1 Tax=Novosphingobium sp. TaxID=1874826 RepID=UPI00286BE23C